MKIDGTRSNDRATEVVLAYLSAFNRGDWAAMLELLDDGVVHDFNPGQRQTGKSAFAAYLHARSETREKLRDIVVMTSPGVVGRSPVMVVLGGIPPTGSPKMPVPGVGWLAYFKDTEGNIFGIFQDDASAK